MSRDSVSLNGVEYYVRNIVIAQPVSDFAAVIRIGEPTYETRQGAGYLVFDDLSGGPGVQQGLAREDLARIADTRGADTRYPRQMTMPLLAVASSTTIQPPDTEQSAQFRTHLRRTDRAAQHYVHDPLGSGATVYDLFAYGNRIYYQKPSEYGLSWANTDPGLDCILDMTTYSPASGALRGSEYIFVVGKTGWKRLKLET